MSPVTDAITAFTTPRMYREVLEVDLPWMDEIVRAKRPQRLLVVLTRDEVRAAHLRTD